MALCQLGYVWWSWLTVLLMSHLQLLGQHQNLESCHYQVIREWSHVEAWNGRCLLVDPKSKAKDLLVPESRVLYYIISWCPTEVIVKLFAYRFGNRRLPNSFEGDPAPALPEPAWVAPPPTPLPKGYRIPDPAGGSSGELVAEAFAERL